MSGLFLHHSPVELFETVFTESGTLAYIAPRNPPALVSSVLASQFHLAVPPLFMGPGGTEPSHPSSSLFSFGALANLKR